MNKKAPAIGGGVMTGATSREKLLAAESIRLWAKVNREGRIMTRVVISEEIMRIRTKVFSFAARCGICGTLIQRLTQKPVMFPVDIVGCQGCGAANEMKGVI